MQIDLVLFSWNKTSKLGKSVFIFKYFTRSLRTLLISYNDCRKSEFSRGSFCFLLCLFVYDAFLLFRCRGSHELGFRTHGRFRSDTIAFSLETKFTDPNVHSMTVPLVFSLQISLNPSAFQEAVLQSLLMKTLWR